ncbi:tetratricopeptide repeat protein [Laribacter hongkongensis]|uniref:tetratricopeptide repeat protein n=1 Tax=Laribacter hongkongensis TaxID=168471 RepID=UPI001EFE149E|nr:tetratricopeptide repeat protein [Laribacter hongkongensis]MCG9077330.1 tetratricopeptide repeat protein [Laribacter hongkongensis]
MNVTRPTLGILLASLLAACSAIRPPVAATPAPAATSKPSTEDSDESRLPRLELDERILFSVVAGEIAGQRGHTGAAAGTFLELAEETRDPRLARRAAEMALISGNLNQAISSLSLWSALDPESQLARQQLALALVRAGRLADARPLLDFLLNSPAAAAPLFGQLAALAPRQPDKAEALNVVRELAGRYPKLPESRFALAAAATEAGADDEADAAIRELARLSPDWAVPVLWRVERLRTQEPAHAVDFLASALADRPQASIDLQLAYPRLLVAEKRYDEARASFAVLAKQAPDHPDILYALGILAIEQQDYDTAEQDLQAALQKGYRDPDFIHLTLGQLAEERDQPEAASAHYLAVRSGRHYPAAQGRQAGLEAKQGKLESGLARLEQLALQTGGKGAELEVWRAQLARDAGQRERAYRMLGSALKRYPQSYLLWFERGMLADQLNRPLDAEKNLRQALRLEPENAMAQNALGYMLANRGVKLREARSLIEKAVAQEPENGMILDSMGWVEFRLGRYPQALEWLEKAYRRLPDGEIAAHIVETLIKLDRPDEARSRAAKALQDHADHDVLTGTLKRLKLAP